MSYTLAAIVLRYARCSCARQSGASPIQRTGQGQCLLNAADRRLLRQSMHGFAGQMARQLFHPIGMHRGGTAALQDFRAIAAGLTRFKRVVVGRWTDFECKDYSWWDR